MFDHPDIRTPFGQSESINVVDESKSKTEINQSESRLGSGEYTSDQSESRIISGEYTPDQSESRIRSGEYTPDQSESRIRSGEYTTWQTSEEEECTSEGGLVSARLVQTVVSDPEVIH